MYNVRMRMCALRTDVRMMLASCSSETKWNHLISSGGLVTVGCLCPDLIYRRRVLRCFIMVLLLGRENEKGKKSWKTVIINFVDCLFVNT